MFEKWSFTYSINLETVKSLIDKANEATIELTVDLENERLTYDDQVIYFEMDPYQKETLLKGLDDIAITMMLEDKIASYEEKCKGIS